MKKKVGVVSLGCPKNLIDSEIMLGLLKGEDYEITADQKDADIIIVNTCGFIESAKQESIDTILEMAGCKKGKCELLIVAGCLAERYKDEIIKEIPEVDAVLGTGSYGEIAGVINRAYNKEKPVLYGKLHEIDYLKNERLVSTGKGYAYLKIAEGCDNCCTYCIIPSLRGKYRSRTMEDILREAESLARGGIKEIILIAQDTTRYGLDLYQERRLTDLIRKISEIEGIEWIRLLYCYPEEIDDRLIEEIAVNKKVCNYLDIPIQHISDRILEQMGRRGNSEDIKKLFKQLRNRIPGIILRSSLIVGFPGEDGTDFDDLNDFVREFEVDRLGVFSYSKEEGTKAAELKNQISKKIKEKRFDTIMALQKEIIASKNKQRLHRVYRTIVEGVSEDGIFYFGRTYAEAPDIDNLVYFTSSEPLKQGEFVNIEVLDADDYDLIGVVIDELTQ